MFSMLSGTNIVQAATKSAKNLRLVDFVSKQVFCNLIIKPDSLCALKVGGDTL